jgi:hypothetical protein
VSHHHRTWVIWHLRYIHSTLYHWPATVSPGPYMTLLHNHLWSSIHTLHLELVSLQDHTWPHYEHSWSSINSIFRKYSHPLTFSTFFLQLESKIE